MSEPEWLASTPSTRGQFANFAPPRTLADLEGEYESSEDEFDFFRIRRRFSFDSSSSDNESIYEQIGGISLSTINSYVYIDDFNAIEAVNLRSALSHITQDKCQLRMRAKGSENLFNNINRLAEDIGMQVNSSKTQMLCINPCIHNRVKTHIIHGGERIESAMTMKILGFNFDSRPNANYHVETLIERFYSRLWTLRFLKRSGISQDNLLEIYYSVLRSAVEYCATVYHSMIPSTLAEKLEGIQRQALKIIFGWNTDIEELMAIKNIPRLEERRQEAVLRFALKNEEREKYGKKWFKLSDEGGREVRLTTRMKYKVPRCRTERMSNNPVINMMKLLNKHYSPTE